MTLEDLMRAANCKTYDDLIQLLFKIADLTGRHDCVNEIIDELDKIESETEDDIII